jgi:copper(I)-binding protein
MHRMLRYITRMSRNRLRRARGWEILVKPRCRWLCLGVTLALFASQAGAMFVVNQPWVVPAPKGRSTAAYMDLTSTEAATLVGARSDAAQEVTIGGRAHPAQSLPKLALPAGRMIRLAPHSYRLVLDKLSRSIKRGERVQLTLVIEAADGSRQEIPVDAEARFNSPLDEERRAHPR